MTAVRKFLSGVVAADGALGEREIRIVANTGLIDRQGDICDPAGADLRAYKTNNVVLYQHDSSQPLGTAWPTVSDGRLEAKVRFADAGISPKIDEVCSLYKTGVLKAASVGFQPLESEPLASGGLRYKRWELLEISLCAVGADSGALTIERSLLAGPGKAAEPARLASTAEGIDFMVKNLTAARKSGRVLSEENMGHLQEVLKCFGKMTDCLTKALDSHGTTHDALQAFADHIETGIEHAKALKNAGRPKPGDGALGEPEGAGGGDADVELAARVGLRRSRLDALDRANVGAAAARKPSTEIGGAFLTQQVRSAEAARIWDRYK